MIGLLQRVSRASVIVAQKTIAHIDSGLLVLIGVERHDTEKQADRLLQRLLAYRVFEDNQGDIWVGTNKGLNRLDEETGEFEQFFENRFFTLSN